MIRAALLSVLAFAALAGVGACDGGEIVVFSAAAAGSGSEITRAGQGGVAGAAGDGRAGSISPAGSAGVGISGGGGGSGNSADISCQITDDCGAAWYCQKQSCADSTGVCLPNPSDEDPMLAPVCDCEDKITYWNDTLRKLKGVSASKSGACMSGVKECMSDHDCGPDPDSHCRHLLRDFNGCMNPGTGQCWVVPSECSASGDRADFLPCPPPGSLPPPPSCLSLCQAINSGIPFFKDKGNNCL